MPDFSSDDDDFQVLEKHTREARGTDFLKGQARLKKSLERRRAAKQKEQKAESKIVVRKREMRRSDSLSMEVKRGRVSSSAQEMESVSSKMRAGVAAPRVSKVENRNPVTSKYAAQDDRYYSTGQYVPYRNTKTRACELPMGRGKIARPREKIHSAESKMAQRSSLRAPPAPRGVQKPKQPMFTLHRGDEESIFGSRNQEPDHYRERQRSGTNRMMAMEVEDSNLRPRDHYQGRRVSRTPPSQRNHAQRNDNWGYHPYRRRTNNSNSSNGEPNFAMAIIFSMIFTSLFWWICSTVSFFSWSLQQLNRTGLQLHHATQWVTNTLSHCAYAVFHCVPGRESLTPINIAVWAHTAIWALVIAYVVQILYFGGAAKKASGSGGAASRASPSGGNNTNKANKSISNKASPERKNDPSVALIAGSRRDRSDSGSQTEMRRSPKNRN